MPDRSVPAAPANVCPRCAARFTCGMQAGLPECWCASLPLALSVPDGEGGCYCPDCLKAIIEQAAAARAGSRHSGG